MKKNLVHINHESVNVDSMKVYIIPSKTDNTMNVGISVKNQMIRVLVNII